MTIVGTVPDFTITDRLRVHSELSPHEEAYTFLREDGNADVITYRNLYDDSRGLAAELLKHAQAGSRALLLYPSGLEFIKAYLACLFAGIIAVPSPIPRKIRSSQRLMAILQDATPSLILTTAYCEQMVKGICFAGNLADCCCLPTDVMEIDSAEKYLSQANGDSTAFLQYTSGSTGTPNGVEVTHSNIMSNVSAIAKALGFSKRSVNVGWLPLFHDMGLIANVLVPLYVGSRSILMSPNTFLRSPYDWLHAISKFRGTCAGSPNFGWDYCVSRISDDKKRELDLSSIEVAYNGSEPVRANTLERFSDSFSNCGFRSEAFMPCYGMAESTLFVSGGPTGKTPTVLNVSMNSLEGNQIRKVAHESEDARQIVSCGQVAEGMRLVVVDPETFLPCTPRRIGEIWIAGDSVAKGYWRLPEETKKTFHAYIANSGDGPFLRSGDLGFIQDGDLFITGRSKDLIVINGRNIYPQDIEQVIERSIDFVEPNMCAAFSVDRDNRETLTIVAEANRSLMRAAQFEQRNTETENDVGRNAKSEYLAKLDGLAGDICTVIADQFDVSVSSIAFVKPGTFPRTSSGKVQRLLCKQMALSGELDIVYVTPESILDRRQARDRTVYSGPALATTTTTKTSIVEAPGVCNQSVQEVGGIDRRQSRQRADEMLKWLRDYAGRQRYFRFVGEDCIVPPSVILDFANKKFFGLQVPLQLGGCELSAVELCRVLEHLARLDLALALLIGVHNGLGMLPILHFGDEAARQQSLPDLAAGRRLAGIALTDAGAGTRPSAMQATALKTEGGWLINAEKQRIGIGSWAGVLTVFATAHDPSGLPLGAVALLVSEDTPGISHRAEPLTMDTPGILQNIVYIKDTFVPDSAILGSVGGGMSVAQDATMFNRLCIGAMSLGAMKRCAQSIMRHAMRRSTSSGVPADNAVTLTKLGALTAAIFATESFIYAIADLVDQGVTVPVEAYIACKTAAPEFLGEAADTLVQYLGAQGCIDTDGASRTIRDAQTMRVFEEPTEVLNVRLGAIVLRQSEPIVDFISNTLNSAPVANRLLKSIADLKSAAARFGSTFSDESSSEQWMHFQVGRLATAAIVLAAAEKMHSRQGENEDSIRAVDWAVQRFVDLRHHVIGWLNDSRRNLSTKQMISIVGQYEFLIGDDERPLTDQGHSLGELMRREKDQEDGTRIESWPLPSAISSVNHPNGPERRLSSFIAVPESPINGPDEIGQVAGLEAAPMRNSGTAAVCPEVATSGTRNIVHDCVVKWLRTEKRRTVEKLEENVPFAILGMDSLGAIMLTLELERRMGVALDPEVVNECQTVDRLAIYIDTNFFNSVRGKETGTTLC